MALRFNPGCLWLVLLIALLGGGPLFVGMIRVFAGLFLLATIGLFAARWYMRRYTLPAFRKAQSEAQKRFVPELVLLLTRLAELDGELDPREVTAIRAYFQQSLRYDDEKLLWIRDLIKESRRSTENTRSICARIAAQFGLQERFIVIRVLTSVAQADGTVKPNEQRFIEEVAGYLGLGAFMGGFGFGGFGQAGGDYGERFSRPSAAHRLNEALATLGLGPEANADEIKSAWRKLSMENHPDRAQHLGEEFAEIAGKRMAEINAAYDDLKKAGRA